MFGFDFRQGQGELIALTALELAFRDRYVGKETERRRKSVTEKAEKEKRKSQKRSVHGATTSPLPIY
ncbi:MAG: hypothetical protein ACLP4V_31025 [Methylocella sp.]